MTSTETLVAMTIRLETVVSDALANVAQREGQEVADYAADILTSHVLPDVKKLDAVAGKRLTAELEVKARAIEIARRLTRQAFDPDVTLKVFQEIRRDDELHKLYLRAIGDRAGDERGNPIKARINRNLGAAIKVAVGALAAKTANGHPVKVPVSGQLIFSYTLLEPSTAKLTA
jgi:hypothetical protein